jgi:SPP1 gp7 family putative phage head morphogenesis protein
MVKKPVRTLSPVTSKKSSWDKVEKAIQTCLKRELYAPLARAAGASGKLLNSRRDLLADITSGGIRYDDTAGSFTGVFTADASRELKALGAGWDKRTLSWKLSQDKIPSDVAEALKAQKVADEALREKVLAAVDAVDPNQVAGGVAVTPELGAALSRSDRDFRTSVRSVAVVPKLTDHAKKDISEQYSTNLKRYVRDFTSEQVLELRKEVEAHVFKGDRYEELSNKVQARYGIGKRKARFLARQETNLMTSALEKARYAEIGVDEYLWQTVAGTAAHPVRPLHKELGARSKRGEVFRFSDPPVTSPSGARNNPGEDFGCRCKARPVVKFKTV